MNKTKIVNIRSIKKTALRYDITVDRTHNFYANGILVHNCQNMDLTELKSVTRTWEITEKVDGSSMTVYLNQGEFGVCSRNWDMKQTEGNSLWKVAVREDLETKLKSTGRNLALQAEIHGFGIQGNGYKLQNQDYAVFSIYDIDKGEYLLPADRRQLCSDLNIKHVPVIDLEFVLTDSVTVDDLLLQAEGLSVLTSAKPQREGLVFKSNTDQVSFKAISNKWLIKNNG